MYAIIRTQKHKSYGTLKSAVGHQLRELKTPNADPKKHRLNFDSVKSSDEAVKNLEGVLAEVKVEKRGFDKRGKDQRTVLAIEYLMALPPDADFLSDKERVKSWATASLDFVRAKHGAANVVSYHLQLDEKTPHLAVFVAPMVKGRLDAKAFLGGPAKLSKLQDAYAAAMSPFGLVRGLKNSKVRHERVGKYYTRAKAHASPAPSRLDLLFMGDSERVEYLRTLEAQHAEALATTEKLQDAQRRQADRITNQSDHIETLRENEALARKAMAKMLKNTFTPAEFEKALGVSLKGKADIFDALIAAGEASNFAQALAKVVIAMPAGKEAAWTAKPRLTPTEAPKEAKTPVFEPATAKRKGMGYGG
jgi:Plasmid recombination enzyme